MRTRLSVILVAAVAGAMLSGCSYFTDETDPTPSVSTPGEAAVGAAPTKPARVRVADLMAKAGCKGKVIGTQLYTYETGRCDLGGTEVTIGVFDTQQLRDQWADGVKNLGGTMVVGTGWAAWVMKPDAATTLASALDGQVL